MPELSMIPNLRSSEVLKGFPWKRPPMPDKIRECGSKPQYRTWCNNASTNHCFFSGVEGAMDTRRVSKEDNEPSFITAFVADYDITTETRETLLLAGTERFPSLPYPPTHASLTFSGGIRAVWLFEQPIPVASAKFARVAFETVGRKVGAAKLFPGLDRASYDPYQYFERGIGWIATGQPAIPMDYLWNWLASAFSKPTLLLDRKEARIPTSRVYPALLEQYPNLPFTSETEFVEGARCRRFWDPAADNDTACILKPDGILCFTGHTPFMKWSDLLGSKFLDDFDADRLGAAVNTYWYDGQYYWKQDKFGSWIASGISDVRNACKVAFGLSSKISSKETCSEVDRAIHAIQETKRVESAIPLVHFPKGPQKISITNGADPRMLLNTSQRFVAVPSTETPETWGDKFPWIAEFLTGFFKDPFQRYIFLAWFQRFYRGALAEKPVVGQGLFLVGPPSCGKSLLAFRIIADAMGGASQADDYLLGETTFSGSFLEAPVMMVDDGEVSTHPRARDKYYSRLKKLVASPSLNYNAKYQKEKALVWRGRIVVTLNDDPASLETLPAMQTSLMDKVIMLKCGHSGATFSGATTVNATVSEELPYFLAWLLQWKPPKGILIPGSRFGVKSFIHPELQEEARDSSGQTETIELLSLFLAEWEASDYAPENGVWKGTTSDLLNQLRACESTKHLVNARINSQGLGRKLRALISAGIPLLNYHTRIGSVWEIPPSALDLSKVRKSDQEKMGYLEEEEE